MKLFYCPICHDLQAIIPNHQRSCCCHKSSSYETRIGGTAILIGHAIPIGIHNTSFLKAIATRPLTGQGQNFTAFVIPKDCTTVKEL